MGVEEFKAKTGYEEDSHVASSERTICDFLMYPEKLKVRRWIYEELEGYMIDHDDDLTKVYR